MTWRGAFAGAWMKGRLAQLRGESAKSCPYNALDTCRGGPTYARAFANAWQDGFDVQAKLAARTSFHTDMFCGACRGPLEDDRNAVCHTCAPESQWFEQAAAAEEIMEAMMATEKKKRPLAQVRPLAMALHALLLDSCVRLEIAGSIRREKPLVGDIELLAIPKVEPVTTVDPGDMFGKSSTVDVNRLWECLDEFEKQQKLLYIRRGPKYRSFQWRLFGTDEWVQVDLFTATPNTWGNQFMIRTGSAEFAHLMMVRYQAKGYCSVDGQLFRAVDRKPTGDPIPTPTEDDVFKLAGLPIVAPKFREAADPRNPSNPF